MSHPLVSAFHFAALNARVYFVQMLAVMGLVFLPISLGAEELKELFYEPFDNGKEEGVIGKAGTGLLAEARGMIDLDRGAFACLNPHNSRTVLTY